MESKDKLKEIDIKNHTCYCFPDTIRFWDRDVEFSDILLDKNYIKKKTKVYGISYITSTGAKPLRIRIDKIDGFIKIRDKIINLVLF